MVWAVGNVGTPGFADYSDVTPVIPTHVTGELLLAFTGMRDQNNSDGETVSESGGNGWTQLVDRMGIGIFGKIALSSSETDPTFAWTGAETNQTTAAVVIVTTGGTMTIEDNNELDNVASTDVTFPALTIATDDTILFDVAFINNNLSFNNTAGYTEIVDASSALGLDGALGVQYLIQTTAANTSSHVGTISASTTSQGASISLQQSTAGSKLVVLKRIRGS
jgi:hypothetical protein